MRILLTISVLCLVILGADAQKKKKPSINKAKTHWEKGELAEAKSIIDDATTYEKTMNNGKTWYYRGLIYASIDTTSDESLAALSDDAMSIAMASFDKAREIDPDEKDYFTYADGGLPRMMSQQINGWYGYYFDEGANGFQEEDYASAVENFEKASQIMKIDTNSVSNAGYAALNMDDNAKALEMFEECLARGGQNKNLIINIIRIHLLAEDNEKALAAVRRGKEMYPTDNMLNRQEVDILRKLGQLDEARDQLKVAIENEPENSLLPFFLGVLYEEDSQPEEAIKWYKRAIEVDPDYYDAHFNIAAIKYNKGSEMRKEVNLLGRSSADQKKAKALEPKIKAAFEEALPLWEKLHELKPDSQDVLERLIYMYDLTNQVAKADAAEKKLNALPEE